MMAEYLQLAGLACIVTGGALLAWWVRSGVTGQSGTSDLNRQIVDLRADLVRRGKEEGEERRSAETRLGEAAAKREAQLTAQFQEWSKGSSGELQALHLQREKIQKQMAKLEELALRAIVVAAEHQNASQEALRKLAVLETKLSKAGGEGA